MLFRSDAVVDIIGNFWGTSFVSEVRERIRADHNTQGLADVDFTPILRQLPSEFGISCKKTLPNILYISLKV